MNRLSIVAALVGAISAFAASAADYPAPKQGTWIARDFVFHTGAAIPDLKLGYTTIGEPTGLPVVVLHGTGQSGAAMLTPAFAGALFGPGQPLDAAKHYIILPDAIGTGASSKPSDGLRQQFPKYNYDDMVTAQHRLVTEGLGVRHIRLVIGNSMGGMHTWLWAQKWPGLMDAAVPMAAQPTAMSARNWMLRRMMTDTIKSDPEFQGGNYTTQPRSLKIANVFYGIATSGGTLAYQDQAPTRALADKLVDARLAAPAPRDANDFLYQWESSGDYDAAPGLEKIRAAVLVINAADDERNPPETGVMQAALARVRDGRMLLIPASTETRGHGTTGAAKFYATELAAFLKSLPERTPARAAAR